MEKQKNVKVFGVAKLFACALLLILSVFLHLKDAGVFSTIPLICIVVPVCSCFYENRRNILATVVVSSLVLSYMYTQELAYCIFFCVLMFAYAYLALFIKRLIVTMKSGKRVLCSVLVVITAALILSSHIWLFGNPILCVRAHKSALSYLESTYGQKAQDFRIGKTHYDIESKRYLTKFEFADELWISAYASDNGESIIDGYKNYAEYLFLSLHKEDILDEAEKIYDVAVRAKSISHFSEKNITLSDDYREYILQMNFELGFYDEFETEEEFLSACTSIVQRLEKTDIGFESITFYAGRGGEFIWQCTAGADGISQVLPFDKEGYTFLSSAKDVQLFWNYPLG